jgi:hypothetical protein
MAWNEAVTYLCNLTMNRRDKSNQNTRDCSNVHTIDCIYLSYKNWQGLKYGKNNVTLVVQENEKKSSTLKYYYIKKERKGEPEKCIDLCTTTP